MCLAPGQGRGVPEGLVPSPQRWVLRACGVQVPEFAVLQPSLLLAVVELPMLAILGKRHLRHTWVSIVNASSAAQLQHKLHMPVRLMNVGIHKAIVITSTSARQAELWKCPICSRMHGADD